MKYILSFIKKMILGFFILYSFNIISANFNMVIPINFVTVSLVTLFGFPGLFALFMLFILVF